MKDIDELIRIMDEKVALVDELGDRVDQLEAHVDELRARLEGVVEREEFPLIAYPPPMQILDERPDDVDQNEIHY